MAGFQQVTYALFVLMFITSREMNLGQNIPLSVLHDSCNTRTTNFSGRHIVSAVSSYRGLCLTVGAFCFSGFL